MSRLHRNAFVCLLVLIGMLPALTRTATAGHVAGGQSEAVIAVYDGRYLVAGRAYESLDALEASVRAARPSALLVVACTPGAARAWLAAVPRFDDVPLHLDVAGGASPLCPAVPMQAAAVTAAASDPAVQQYWNARMP